MAEYNQQINVLQQIEKAREAIKRKYNSLKFNKMEAEKIVSETFKPIVEPLEKLVDESKLTEQYKVRKLKSEPEFTPEYRLKKHKSESEDFDDEITQKDDNPIENEEAENSFDDLKISSPANDTFHTPESDSLQKYLSMLRKDQVTSLDTVYGVRQLKNGPQMIGNQRIYFENDKIVINDKSYEKSNGLIELLFKKKPSHTLVTHKDLLNYGEIINNTNAHRKYYKPDGEIRHQTSEKYRDIISRLINVRGNSPRLGSGLPPPYKIARQNVLTDYVYWDNPNELVDRLRLLIAETSAGNQNHVNEIHSIIEELREAEIIY